jgi:hypothetical protein
MSRTALDSSRRYNGSRGRAAYPDAVLAARRRWVVAGGSG